jgi:hypothetical protein
VNDVPLGNIGRLTCGPIQLCVMADAMGASATMAAVTAVPTRTSLVRMDMVASRLSWIKQADRQLIVLVRHPSIDVGNPCQSYAGVVFPPKLHLVGSDWRARWWRMLHALPTYAVLHLTDSLPLQGQRLSHVVDLTAGVDEVEHRDLLVEIDRLEHQGRVVICTEDDVRVAVEAWRMYEEAVRRYPAPDPSRAWPSTSPS